MSDFEQKVLSDLAELKAHMRWLVGNGNEGKVQDLEARVDRHEAYLQRFAGIATAVACLLTFVHLAIDLLKYRRYGRNQTQPRIDADERGLNEFLCSKIGVHPRKSVVKQTIQIQETSGFGKPDRRMLAPKSQVFVE